MTFQFGKTLISGSKFFRTTFGNRYLTDRSFRLANVSDLYAAQNYRDKLSNQHFASFRATSELKPRDISKQIVIDLSHEQGYRRGHIPGAFNLSVEKFDFTRPVDVYGGIALEETVNTFKNIGVSNDTSEIILYDNSGLLACRLWFVLRYFGFRNIRILNGGWRSWLKSGLPVSGDASETKVATSLTLKPKRTKLLTRPSQMLFDFEHKTSQYVDTRNSEAYSTYHIEGAINIPSRNLMEDSRFASVHEIREKIMETKINIEDKIILYSSEGLTSCVGLFAFQMIGSNSVSLYDAGINNWKNCFDDKLPPNATDFLSG